MLKMSQRVCPAMFFVTATVGFVAALCFEIEKVNHSLKTIQHEGKEVLVMDYSGLKEKEMIDLVSEIRNTVITSNAPVRILVIFDEKTFVTPRFMRHVEKASEEIIHMIADVAFTGMNDAKEFILKGYNLKSKKSFPSFDTREKALDYLTRSAEKC